MAKEPQMSVMEKLRALEAERETLLNQAKDDALSRAEEAVKELRELGFNYRLVETDSERPTRTRAPSTGTRRTGIREQVLDIVKRHPDGISAADIRSQMGIEEGDKSGYQSVANALANAKKQGQIDLTDGLYKAA